MTAMRRVVLVATDLFFVARIAETARAAGISLETAAPAAALEACRAAPTDLVILDLHGPGDPIALAAALKADATTRRVPIVGYFSHVEHELGARARAAGIDHVLPRSAFTARLPRLLAGDGVSD